MQPTRRHCWRNRGRAWRFLRRLPLNDRTTLDFARVQGSTVSGAAVRVQRCMRRLRRNALRAPAVAAVWRSFAGRERHGLFVDLWRQPADDAVDGEQGRSGTGLVEFAVRRQRRVRARHARERRQAHCRMRMTCCANSSGRSGKNSLPIFIEAPQVLESEISAQRERVGATESGPARTR